MNVAVMASTNGTDMDALLGGEYLQLVICNKECGAAEKGRAHNIETIIVDEKDRVAFAQDVMQLLTEKNIDLVVLIGFMKILSKAYIDTWGLKTMNIHPSLLPAFAGGMDTNVHEEVLKRGCKVTGCTLHFIDEGADTGPIIAQTIVPVADDETVDSLKEKVQQAEIDTIRTAVEQYAQGKITINGDKVTVA
ncbi:MAG: formyltransferase family protein [Candidatus Woesearchaeota archaeon]|nr:formyltransferase family protein [Candidatus Woesearchaeota archaeon]